MTGGQTNEQMDIGGCRVTFATEKFSGEWLVALQL